MKIHALELGRTKVPFGQFYGGTGAWRGDGGLAEFLSDKSHYVWVPIRAYLIEHPNGRILVDTGISPAQAEHVDYYRDTVLQYVLDVDEYEIPAGQTMVEQLAALGLTPRDIDTVVVTHLHEDHIGNLPLFPDARVLIARAEYASRDALALGVMPMVFDRSLPASTRWELVDFDGPSVPGFDASFDVLGDGTVVVVPTPGHTPGSVSVLADLGDHRVLMTGDALYTLRHLAVDDVRAIQFGPETTYSESIRRVQWLRRLAPQVVLLPAHDHTVYGTRIVEALRTHGRLDADTLAWVADHERQLFDPAYRINPARLPRFVPGRDRGPIGSAV